MSQEQVNRKLSCILSTDVAGYSRLMEENEASTVRYLEENKKLITRLIEENKGRVVDSPGDNLLAEFSSAVKAVDCAVKIQKELKIKNADLLENKRMQFRIGINLGDVIEEDGRLYGSGVNIAARLEGLADPGGICISKKVYDEIKTKLDLGYEYLGEHEVKNITEPVQVYRVQTGVVTAAEKVNKKVNIGISRMRNIGTFLVILIVGLIVWRFYPNQSIKTEPASIENEQTTAVKEKQAPKSIAVLPFDNLSSDPEQEYFSDGLADALITKLSQVKDLQVTARTSSFYFKGKNVDMRKIGHTLGVSYLLEGSVQKSGNKLRVIAQLIKAADSYHLWSETYDRELEDIFSIQDEIIKAVTTALSVTLGVGEFGRPGMTHSIEAYDAYLRACASELKNTPDSILTAIDQLKRALDIDPDFGLAWLKFWDVYPYAIVLLPPDQTVDFRAKAADALKHARNVAPDMQELMMITAEQHQRNGNWLEADQLFKQILDEQGHVNSEANDEYGYFVLVCAGRNTDAIPYLQRAKRLDPLRAVISFDLSVALLNSNKIEEALVEARIGQTLQGFGRLPIIVEFLYSLEVNDRPGAAAVINTYYNLEGDYPDATILRLAELLLRKDAETALFELRKLSERSDISPNARMYLAHIASEMGDVELAFESLQKSRLNDRLVAIWHPIHRGIRKLPAFNAYVREIGLYDYWRATGKWPDLCHPVGEDDFVCE